MEIDNSIAVLHEQIAAVCPIDGVSIGRWNDRSTWRIDFKAEATPEQRHAAQMVREAFSHAAAQAEQAAKRARAAAVESKMRELAERMVDNPTLLDRLAPRRVLP